MEFTELNDVAVALLAYENQSKLLQPKPAGKLTSALVCMLLERTDELSMVQAHKLVNRLAIVM